MIAVLNSVPDNPGSEIALSGSLFDLLQQGLEKMHLRLDAAQIDALLSYISLLTKWNRVFNLTAVRDPVQMISRHLLDSLTVLPHISGTTLLDVGSGAGLPGIPIAITQPQLVCTLLDSNSKKTRFMQQAVAELHLDNVTVIHSRVEDANLTPADTLVSRAFSSPLDIIEVAGHLCADHGVMLFMLGHTGRLLDELPVNFQLTRLESVTVPFEEGTRHIAVCRHG